MGIEAPITTKYLLPTLKIGVFQVILSNEDASGQCQTTLSCKSIPPSSLSSTNFIISISYATTETPCLSLEKCCILTEIFIANLPLSCAVHDPLPSQICKGMIKHKNEF